MPDDSLARYDARRDGVPAESVVPQKAARPAGTGGWSAGWTPHLATFLASRRAGLVAFAVLLAAAFLLRFGLGLALPRFHHPDELFQYYEQAHRLAFGTGVIPWEYRDGIRSWVLPGLIAGIMRLVAPLGGPEVYFAATRALLSVLSLGIVVIAFLWARRMAGHLAGILAAAITAIWFELVYFAPAALTESIGAVGLFAGAYLAATAATAEASALRRRLAAAGLLLGLTFVMRFHLGPALLAVAILACGRDWRGRWLPLLAGGLVPLAALALLDWATLGWPLQSVVKNFWINIVDQRSHHYGVMPPGHYLGAYAEAWWWWSVPILAAIAWACRPPGAAAPGGRAMLWLVPLTVIASHSLVAHKEYRFVLPALPFLLTLAAIGSAALVRHLERRLDIALPAAAGAVILLWAAASGALALREPWAAEWTRSGPQIAATSAVGTRPDLCGLGVLMSWGEFTGYASLHRDVPVIWSPERGEMAASRTAYNYLLANPAAPPPTEWGYRMEACWGGNSCIYHRAGGCSGDAAPTINSSLERLGD